MIRDAHGTELVALLAVDERDLRSYPPTYAVVVACHHGTTLLVFNRHKQHWELPGGMRDAGESARRCAARELSEESGLTCDVDALRFWGVLKTRVGRATAGTQIEHGAVYTVQIDRLMPFAPTDEVSEVMWWDGVAQVDRVSPVDRAVIEWWRNRPAS